MLNKRGTGIGIVADTIAANPRIRERESENENEEKNTLETTLLLEVRFQMNFGPPEEQTSRQRQ